MKQFEHTVNNPEGIHARPAGLLAKEAQKYTSTITLTKGEKEADLKRLIAVMGLAVKQGATVTVRLDGSDEDAAAEQLELFMKRNF